MKRVFALTLVLVVGALGCRKAPAAATAPPAAAPAATAIGPNGQPLPAPAKPMPATLPGVLAKVNGEPVERWELENALKRAEARAGSPVPAEQRNEVLRNILDQLVVFHLLAQESRARNIAVSDADVEQQMISIRQSFGTDQAFQQGIAQQGLTLDQLRKQTRDSLQVQKLMETEVNAKVSVSDADVSTFYNQNLERFKEGDSVHASHILIALPQNPDPKQKEAARGTAAQILKELRGGADFAKLAKERSQDPGSAPNGGDLGFFAKGQMTPTFDAEAFRLKPGATSGIVESPFGFHIIRVHERRAPRTAPLTEVGSQIKDYLVQGQRQTKLNELVEQTKAKVKVEILV